MEITVILFVFAVTAVFGYPAEFNLDDRISNDISGDPGRIYKLPRAIIDNYEIEVNGTLNSEDNTFSVLLPDSTRTDNCQIVHNFKENIIRVSPAPPGTAESRNFTVITAHKETEFLLTLKANSVDSMQILDVSFLAVESGLVEDLRCVVKFDDLGYIMFIEGVLRIKSILFKFQ